MLWATDGENVYACVSAVSISHHACDTLPCRVRFMTGMIELYGTLLHSTGIQKKFLNTVDSLLMHTSSRSRDSPRGMGY
jgi:hypothetical protein